MTVKDPQNLINKRKIENDKLHISDNLIYDYKYYLEFRYLNQKYAI